MNDSVKSQIESVSNTLVGVECVIRNVVDNQVILPNGVSQINHFSEYIGVYCGDLFIKIIGQANNINLGFIILKE